jgi:hypothetical protein
MVISSFWPRLALDSDGHRERFVGRILQGPFLKVFMGPVSKPNTGFQPIF